MEQTLRIGSIIALLCSICACTNSRLVLPENHLSAIRHDVAVIADSLYGADSSAVYLVSIREEMYFPRIRNLSISIYNPTMPLLDLKPLIVDGNNPYQDSVVDTEEFWAHVTEEADKVLRYIAHHKRVISNSDQIVVQFEKTDSAGLPYFDYSEFYRVTDTGIINN